MPGVGAGPAGGGLGDMFLMVKGARSGLIKGESQDADHKGEIEVLSWSWGMQARSSLGGGAATGKSSVLDLKVRKRVDSASTALMSALRSNEVIQKAVLTLRKAGRAPLEFFKVTIEQGRITGLNIEAGDTAGSPEMFEHITFSFNKITVDYTLQGRDGQSLGGTQFFDEFGDAR